MRIKERLTWVSSRKAFYTLRSACRQKDHKMSKKAELFAIQSSKGFIKSSGVQSGEFTPDLASAKLYNSELKASNMMKGWSKKQEWDAVCWVAKIEVAVVGKVEAAAEEPATIRKKKTTTKAVKKTAKKAKAKKRA